MVGPASALSRRRFLASGGAALAGTMLFGACGGDDATTVTEGPSTSGSGSDGADLALAQFFGGPIFVAGAPLRAPFGVADRDGLLPTEDTPEELEVQLFDADDAEVGDPLIVARHAEGLPRPYFPLVTELPKAGIYTARASVGGATPEMSFQVYDPSGVKVIQPGAALPAIESPTTTDARGVDPICTNDPVCPLHDVTAAEAVTAGTPVALLVATPAFCQIAICGPVLDVLLAGLADHPGVKGIHAEVYAHPYQELDTYAPAAGALGLHFEPCLVLVGSDGTVQQRLDTIYDAAELDEALAALS